MLFWDLGFGIWDLGFGIWDLGFGIWDLGFGIWDLGFGIWDLGFGIWDLGFGIWDLGFGIWDLGFGIWDLGFGIWDLGFGMLLHKVISTEKVPFTYKIAGVGARSLAWMIDALVLVLLGFIGFMGANVIALSGYMGMAQGSFQLWVFVLTWCYFLVFEWCWGGQTPGKRLLGLRVIRWQGTGIGFMAAAVRNLVRIVDFLPAGYFVGFAVASCNRENRRLGDLAAGTLVVYVERQQALVRNLQEMNSTASSERGQLIQLRQRLNQLDRERKQTLLDLALRRNQLRLPERAQLFHAAALYLEKRLELPANEYESDEKYVLRLATLLGQQ